ncbi:hypothetical protein TRVL_05557 [Trypanosoma vivax]|uniref:Uncharacterized protein n=1 Tax=Trypanosoma vivax (strain Y486) TaxID=1055687 RepID=G0U8A8_TRYVY|nr:hypothetical protein TRVL_05557 [Trypanosoma vivax]CCC52119.1 conserved hypothetical protein [Trypanosoma vivax Y486]
MHVPLEAALWWIIFAVSGATVENATTALLSFLFSVLVALTMPVSLLELRNAILPGGKWAGKAVEGGEIRRKRSEVLVLLTAILFGAIFTQLDWAVWFQAWPVPAFVTYTVARVALAVGSKK